MRPDAEQYRLYRLIWSRFLASQMANAVYDSVSVELAAGDHTFRCSASNLKFAGYTAVYEESRDDDKEEKESPLPPLTEGEEVTPTGFAPRPALHPAAGALYRRHPHPHHGGKRHRPPLHLRAHRLHHSRPRVCHQGGQVPAHTPLGGWSTA